MFFLMEYDRGKGELVNFTSFLEVDQGNAETERLNLERRLHGLRVDHEVVLLEAPNEQALRRTHRRYFENAHQIGQSVTEG